MMGTFKNLDILRDEPFFNKAKNATNQPITRKSLPLRSVTTALLLKMSGKKKYKSLVYLLG